MKKREIVVITAVALAVAVISAAIILSIRPLGRTLNNDDIERIAKRFDTYIENRDFSGSVYAVYHGAVVYDGGATREGDEQENGSDVAYGVASLTKQFTAAGVMQLYEDGKLDLDDRLSRYFPDYRYGDRITVEQLLCQRSGIPDYSVDSDDDGTVVVTCYGSSDRIVVDSESSAQENAEKIRSFFLSRELLFEPGSRFNYSDSNYALLAEIIAQVSGMSYHEYIRQHMFIPLKMTHSAFIDDYDSAVITKIASVDHEAFSGDYFDYAGVEYGCGDILTTPQDLYLWYRGLTGGKVVSKDSYQKMTENYSDPEELSYGYGLMTSDEGDSKMVYHYGYIPSYYSSVIYIPEYDYFQAVIANHAGGKPYQTASDMAVYFGSVIGLKLVKIM